MKRWRRRSTMMSCLPHLFSRQDGLLQPYWAKLLHAHHVPCDSLALHPLVGCLGRRCQERKSTSPCPPQEGRGQRPALMEVRKVPARGIPPTTVTHLFFIRNDCLDTSTRHYHSYLSTQVRSSWMRRKLRIRALQEGVAKRAPQLQAPAAPASQAALSRDWEPVEEAP